MKKGQEAKLAYIIHKRDRGKERETKNEQQKYHSPLFSSSFTFATYVKGNTGHDICITSENPKRIEFFVSLQSSSWLSSTNCKTNKLLVKFQISAFSMFHYQICPYLAESEVISFQWSPTVLKLKFSMECHLTSSLSKGQPVLEKKTTCCHQLLI